MFSDQASIEKTQNPRIRNGVNKALRKIHMIQNESSLDSIKPKRRLNASLDLSRKPLDTLAGVRSPTNALN